MIVTFFWPGVGRWGGVWVGVGECDLFKAGCGWVCVSARFVTTIIQLLIQLA